MTLKENIRAILECYFAGYKEEIIDSCCNRIYYEVKLKGCIDNLLDYNKDTSTDNMSEQERWKKGL